MRLLDKYIVFSSVFALFTESFTYNFIIDWKLFYVILLSNVFILGYKKKLVVHKNIIYLVLFFFLHGLVMFILHKNPIASLISQIIGISISSFYYYNFIKLYKPKFLLEVYLDFAFWIAVLAIPMFYFHINQFTEGRLNGILLEPAHYATIMLPAIFLFLRKKLYIKLVIVLFTVIISKSSVGYIGLILILFIPLLKLKYFLKYSFVVLIIISGAVYYINSQWNSQTGENEGSEIVRRVKQTKESINAINTGKFQPYANLSSYALLSNTYITKRIFFNNPFGAGLGSYKHQYEKFYIDMSPPPYLINLKLSKINQHDANSLFLRIISDLGIFGFILVFYFIYLGIKLFKNEKKYHRQSTFFYLSVKLIREGHYFPPEFYFFLLIFLKDFNEDTSYC